ncbi:sigma-70 family RNA polymerase sigma factor [Arthrobacter sp. fls2-241-R2A-200]|uniref:sigma-70 family RNA polymerase sigma factor n=2 Tax=Bacillati TaxID=1783272 RepID=UPI00254A2883|nr:sigma-70 family RNA polymerase sigma factor [Arthrobacter sp. fls2-241-R2A-200]
MDQLFAVGADGASPDLAKAKDDDPHIIALVRQGVTDAFNVLYERHLKVAQYVARAQTDNPSDADDVVAESFAAIFQLLREGKGPNEFFRSYLLTVVRRTAHDRNRKARRMATAADDAILDTAVTDSDPVLSDLESTIMAKAFKSLPERWQAVLWHVDIEGLKPAAAAPLVGLTPNGVSSLAIRAREGLRQAYLQQHISQTVDAACGEFASQLGRYARNALKRTSQEKVSAHLETCAKCTALLIELNDVQGGMRAVLIPLITGIAFTPGVAASLASAATAMGPSSGAGSTAVPAQAQRPGGLGRLVRLAAAIALGVVALVAVLVWFAQASSTTHAPVATDEASKAPARPTAGNPSPIATANAGPTVTPSVPISSPSSTPEPGSAPSSPAAAVQAGEPAVSGPQATVVVVPSVGLPPRSSTVVDSGLVSATTAPQAVAAASTETVDATFASSIGPSAAERQLQVQFSLQGNGTPTAAEVVFTLPDQAGFVQGRTRAPSGWTCADTGSAGKQIRCSTDAMDPQQLAFALEVSLPAGSGSGTLNYQFGGQGIVPTTFSNTFN